MRDDGVYAPWQHGQVDYRAPSPSAMDCVVREYGEYSHLSYGAQREVYMHENGMYAHTERGQVEFPVSALDRVAQQYDDYPRLVASALDETAQYYQSLKRKPKERAPPSPAGKRVHLRPHVENEASRPAPRPVRQRSVSELRMPLYSCVDTM
jgi:hypothetical protein